MSQGPGSNNTSTQHVVDFGEARSQRLDEKRRKTERIFFKQLLSVYCVTETNSKNSVIRPIEPIDISEDGFGFQTPFNATDPWPKSTEELTIRLYFNQDTYIPVLLKVVNSRPCIENGVRYVRYGCKVDQTVSSYPAYQQFVRFLKAFAEHAHKDMGDVTVFYL